MVETEGKRRVFVVGPHSEGRGALKSSLQDRGFSVAECSDANGLADELDGVVPACVVVDITTGKFEGLEGLAEFRKHRPNAQVLLLVGCQAAVSTLTLLQSPNVDVVSGFADRSTEFLNLVESAFDIDNGTVEATAAMTSPKRDTLLAQLSPREREVLKLLVEGKQNKAVAHDLGISPRTVEVHRSRLMRRLNVSSFAELIRFALEAGLGKAA